MAARAALLLRLAPLAPALLLLALAAPGAARAQQAVVSFHLVDADADTVLYQMADGGTIDLDALPTANLNVRADTDPPTVGSVVFDLNGQLNYKTENGAPYALAGDQGGDYGPWTPGLGQLEITATPYSSTYGGGTPGTPLTITMQVVCSSCPVTASFGKDLLVGHGLSNPTSLQFGPDGRLYVAEQAGTIVALQIQRDGPNDYTVLSMEEITKLLDLPNHDDDGSLNPNVTGRQVTGIVVAGTAQNPVIYATSCDPRMGGGNGGEPSDLDTNSAILSRLSWDGVFWVHEQLVRGLPKSERSHSTNGLLLDEVANTIYIAVGGNTNMGAPSTNFAMIPEYALAACVLSVDLGALGPLPYDLPTLDDEDRPGVADANDPFGGNDGKNQAVLVPGGPVQVYAPGLRNPYDLLRHSNGHIYTVDNGPNAGWGAAPTTCDNSQSEPGISSADQLHRIDVPGFYGGHPNPTRADTNVTFNATNPQSPVDAPNPVECSYVFPGSDGSLASWSHSTNGLAEYTASNFNGAMQGDLVAAGWNNTLQRVVLDASGDSVLVKETLFNNVSGNPLDVICQGDGEPFPGTIWAIDYAFNQLLVYEPSDYDGGTAGNCAGSYDAGLDDDNDGYDNADEIDAGSNPCSAADTPPDHDGDLVSDFNDPDDDNDGQPDTSDPFAVDASNGASTALPLVWSWDVDEPRPGGLLGLGWTGMMANGNDDYLGLFDQDNMTVVGAAGVMSVDAVPAGTAVGTSNDQAYAFQVGLPANGSSAPFTIRSRINGPFAGTTPQDDQAMGIYFGDGSQDGFAALRLVANGGQGAVELLVEVGGTPTVVATAALELPGPDWVDLSIRVVPATLSLSATYEYQRSGQRHHTEAVGGWTAFPAAWLGGTNGPAAGVIATSAGPGPEFAVTWDFFEVTSEPATPVPPTARVTALGQNVPNPFNPRTVIHFQLARPGLAKLTVHDAAGRRVATLVDGELPAGPHQFSWAGLDHERQEVSTGVYYYRLVSGGFEQTRKMVLVR